MSCACPMHVLRMHYAYPVRARRMPYASSTCPARALRVPYACPGRFLALCVFKPYACPMCALHAHCACLTRVLSAPRTNPTYPTRALRVPYACPTSAIRMPYAGPARALHVPYSWPLSALRALYAGPCQCLTPFWFPLVPLVPLGPDRRSLGDLLERFRVPCAYPVHALHIHYACPARARRYPMRALPVPYAGPAHAPRVPYACPTHAPLRVA